MMKNLIFQRSAKWHRKILLYILVVIASAGIHITFPHFLLNAQAQNRFSNIPELVEQGRALYESGRFNDAVTVLLRAISNSSAEQDRLMQATIFSNLSLAYQQLGEWKKAEKYVTESLNLLEAERKLGDSTNRLKVLAQTLDIQGRLQLETGQAEQALTSWKETVNIYEKISDNAGKIRSQINTAQALQSIGLYNRAEKTLEDVKKIIEQQPNSLEKASLLRSLGDVLQVIGDLDKSEIVLKKSLEVAQLLQSPPEISATLLSLGNMERSKGNKILSQQDSAIKPNITPLNCPYRSSQEAALFYTRAANFYQDATTKSVSPTTRLQAKLNYLSVSLSTANLANIQEALPEIKAELKELPASRTAIYAKINYAKTLTCLKQTNQVNTLSWKEIAQFLAMAVQEARSLEDKQAESYALGYLGGLYLENQDINHSKEITEQALIIAQAIKAREITYLWEWQLGYLLEKQRDIKGAIAAYEAAVGDLKFIRQDLLANADIEFLFRKSVEPIYRQLVELLLPSSGDQPIQDNLDKARQLVADLQVAELENFLGCSLQNQKSVKLDKVADENNAAILYPIILPTRLAVIVKLPKQDDLLYYESNVNQIEVKSNIEQLRQKIQNPASESQEYLSLSQKLYEWLIEPAEKYPKTPLDSKQVKTLVFVQDGKLRQIPMAAIYDGKEYLIEKYAVALNLGLELQNPRNIRQERLEALSAGITKKLPGLDRLEYAGIELNTIKNLVSTKELRDEKFIRDDFKNLLNSRPFSVVHLATHGQFSSQPEKTFIRAFDTSINIKELSDIFRIQSQNRSEPIELLVLSACQTATEDERSVLGLAGIAVRSGARSTIASLWFLNDQSSAQLMELFYNNLRNPKVPNKVEALRLAQKELLTNPKYGYEAPAHWASYILVGNWL
ncbi:CHAT domain-containing protein [Planktothrix sp. FACHB-1355]|uniref:CHAT domain-containing protein n=1 Tax=Aerosakkonema funiforme FACHB-1375 TaxID=2949571 RepID=A0A926VBP3_9CYAN|nr:MULTISPECIES: CHAT domain-containing protein [Oscillatoriales]MBD2180585.1 CHAT domain-containing protein [Aerosakkonema funiforme FACHB-1375]MBD3558881.1 CHAT domain-containing protein [Planktothrix sp. FACHB-1355]